MSTQSALNPRPLNLLAALEAAFGQTWRTARALAWVKHVLNRPIPRPRIVDDGAGQAESGEVELHALLAEIACSYASGDESRLRISGPAVTLDAASALAMSLVLHELALNAAKFGALSNDSGRVDVHWELWPQRRAGKLDLLWRETGGPAVIPPARRGFGSLLIQRLVAGELRGSASVQFLSGGVQWILRGC